jgi:hypothetical protein
VPLSSEQNLLPVAVPAFPGDGAWPAAPLAAGQAYKRRACARAAARARARARHRRHVLHPRLQRQSELTPHTIAVTAQLFPRRPIQVPDISLGSS